jgi:hypothetical protein
MGACWVVVLGIHSSVVVQGTCCYWCCGHLSSLGGGDVGCWSPLVAWAPIIVCGVVVSFGAGGAAHSPLVGVVFRS